jgi:hypothetical protein
MIEVRINLFNTMCQMRYLITQDITQLQFILQLCYNNITFMLI